MNSSHSLRNLLIINLLINLTVATNSRLGEPPIQRTQPTYWGDKTRRIYLQTRTGHFLEICPGAKFGGIRGVHQKTEYAILEQISGANLSVVIRGAHSNLYVCMDSNSELYASDKITEDCYFKENYHHSYNVYHHRSHRERKTKFYIGIDRSGRARKGIEARKSQKMSQFTPLDYKNDSVQSSKECISGEFKVIDSDSSASNRPKVDPEKVKREQTRKRRRRWCKRLLSGKLERNPEKYRTRCKYDCEILRQMLENPTKYKRKCEKAKRKRKLRKIRLHKLHHLRHKKQWQVVRGQRGHHERESEGNRRRTLTLERAESGA